MGAPSTNTKAKRVRDGAVIEIDESWPTREELCETLGRHKSTVIRFESDGRLDGRALDESGAMRYDPQEVAALEDDRSRVKPKLTRDQRREEFQDYELSTIKQLVDLVKVPRDKIDEMMFRLLGHLEKRNAELEALVSSLRGEIDKARDDNTERDIARQIAGSETKIKEMAANRLMSTLQAIMSGGKSNGLELSPQQLQELLMAGQFFTPEQEKQAKVTVLAWLAAEKKKADELEAQAKNGAPGKVVESGPSGSDGSTGSNPG